MQKISKTRHSAISRRASTSRGWPRGSHCWVDPPPHIYPATRDAGTNAVQGARYVATGRHVVRYRDAAAYDTAIAAEYVPRLLLCFIFLLSTGYTKLPPANPLATRGACVTAPSPSAREAPARAVPREKHRPASTGGVPGATCGVRFSHRSLHESAKRRDLCWPLLVV